MFKKLKILLLAGIFVLPFALSGCETMNKDALSVPKNLTVQTNGIIQFERVDNDEYYIIDINGQEVIVFANKPNKYTETYVNNGVNYLEYDASRMLNLGESYSVKVKACAKNKKASQFSTVFSYAHNKSLSTPNPQRTGTVLTWEHVENAGYYNIKVVRPIDQLEKDDPESIKNADIMSYQYSVNRFDFASILASQGEYKFYVNAVGKGAQYLESDFCQKITYKHYVKLQAPCSSKIYNVGNQVHLTTVLDENANSLKITINGYEILADVNDVSIVKDSTAHNVLDVNLSTLFASTELNLQQPEQFTISVQSVHQSPSENYFINSDVCNNIIYESIKQLDVPELSLTKSEFDNSYVASWQVASSEGISGVAVYVTTASGVQKTVLPIKNTSMIMPKNFISVFVQAIGQGNYEDSAFSQHKSRYSAEMDGNITAQIVGQQITLTADYCSYYLIEVGNRLFTVAQTLNLQEVDGVINSIKVTAISDNFAATTNTFTVDASKLAFYQLATPAYHGYGFNSSNPYLLTFGQVENALGYKIYLTQHDEESSAVAIPKLFTTNVVDLSPYIIKGGKYYVQVQAVADAYCGLTSSQLTPFKALSLTYELVLEKPEFKKDIYGKPEPVQKTTSGNQTKYFLNFYGVQGAYKYEVLINYSTLTVMDTGKTDAYSVDITSYLTSANKYTLMVRAIPDPSNENRAASAYSTADYELLMQLKEVTNIKVTELDDSRTLSFDLQDNATGGYRVRIVKLNDSGYSDYLSTIGLSSIFVVTGSCDITEYVEQAGEYYIYITALAGMGSYYLDADESTTYATVSKLTSLKTPSNVQYSNQTKNTFLIRWEGDDNADYYTVRVFAPNGHLFEYQVNGATQYNINAAIGQEGDYGISIKAHIKPTGENAKYYVSSPFSTEHIIAHRHEEIYDFERYSVFYNGEDYNFAISNIKQLTNILWRHYLFGVDPNYNLKVYITHTAEQSVNDAILELVEQAENDDLLLYNFSNDSNWNELLNEGTDAQRLGYICQVLLNLYPELSVLQNFSIAPVNDEIFKINYSNALDQEKVNTEVDYINTPTDYANDYEYLSKFLRRNANTTFAIDSCPEMEVTTTEQLLMAVQYSKKPVFVGNSFVAETVYKNAKAVLVAIASKNMSDYDKTTAIFNWLSYAYNLNNSARLVYKDSALVEAEKSVYALRKEFYLEGIFLDIGNANNNGFDGEFYLGNKNATSESLSKAFTLLCGIEGIKARKVNGTLTYSQKTVGHNWNKVYLKVEEDVDAAWYNVDIVNSDTKYMSSNFNNSYAYAGHLFYLVSDSFMESNLNFGTTENKVKVLVDEFKNKVLSLNEQIETIETSFNYYANSTFGLTVEEIKATINNLQVGAAQNFTYNMEYDSTLEYQAYNGTAGYNSIQRYLLNSLLFAKHKLITNNLNAASFEFRIGLSGGVLQGQQTLDAILATVNNAYRQTANSGDTGIVGSEADLKIKYHHTFDTASSLTTYTFVLYFDEK